MIRNFARSSLDAEHHSSAYKIICRQCGKIDKIGIGSRSGSLPPEVSAKKFKQRGWVIGNKLGDDLCNICVASNKIVRKQPDATVTPITLKLENLSKLYETQMAAGNPKIDAAPEFTTAQETPVEKLYNVKEAHEAGFADLNKIYRLINAQKLECIKNAKGAFMLRESDLIRVFGPLKGQLKPTSVVDPAPAVVDPTPLLNDGVSDMNFDPKVPQEMTKEDRRIIFAEIDMHYLDETRGYEAAYDDKRVAEGLKVPMAWVRTIREDNFGPERGEAINTELENLRSAKEDIDKSIAAMRDLWEEINKTLDAFVVRHNDLSNEAKKSRETATAMMIKIDYLTRK